jgi:hypothetical protein
MMGQFIDTGIVEICKDDSDWRGHTVLQKKKDGKTRFMCDYRHTGPETCEKYQHPLPLIQKILDNLRGARYFTKNKLHRWLSYAMLNGAMLVIYLFNPLKLPWDVQYSYGHYKI